MIQLMKAFQEKTPAFLLALCIWAPFEAFSKGPHLLMIVTIISVNFPN